MLCFAVVVLLLVRERQTGIISSHPLDGILPFLFYGEEYDIILQHISGSSNITQGEEVHDGSHYPAVQALRPGQGNRPC